MLFPGTPIGNLFNHQSLGCPTCKTCVATAPPHAGVPRVLGKRVRYSARAAASPTSQLHLVHQRPGRYTPLPDLVGVAHKLVLACFSPRMKMKAKARPLYGL